jgi:exodeoxyribonuclease V beta subunit
MTYDEVLSLGRMAVGSDRSAQLWPLAATGVPGQRRGAAYRVRAEVQNRKRQLALVDYDDWLVLLRDALADPVHGPVACERVRSRYRIVLVDEFQDTDPVQWEVLQLAFHGHTTLVLIGDPKQAIYAFRGGDVTTYLAASALATSAATLTRNWRSDTGLLSALEQLFGGAALGDPRIVVRPVDSAHPEPRLTGAGQPLRLRHLTRTGHGSLYKGMPKIDPVREAVATDVATDVVALLTGPARLHGQSVQPADIAVLVRTNKQGALVRAALATAGVPAVVAGGGSVYTTSSAPQWLRLLEAMEQPHRAGRVRSAALTVFLGYADATLDQADDELTDALAQRLRRWAELLADRGVAAFFEQLTAEEQLPARLLAQPDGERLLTDLRHLAQSLHAAAVQDALGLTALVEWLRRRIAQAAQEATDERSRRLESDAAAVQVMTVHVSKGLEFAIVYVPYGWDRWTPSKPDLLRLHDEHGQRVLDVGGPDGPGYADARTQHESIESGEDLRLLYVALTRAKCHVVAHWAPSLNTAAAPLHRLLFGAAGPGIEPAAAITPPSDADAAARLTDLAAGSSGWISSDLVTPGPIPRWQPPQPPVPTLDVSHFTRQLDTAWTRTSYSGLTADVHHSAGVASETDEPVKDDEQNDSADSEHEVPPPAAVRSPMADLPAGAAFGTLVHDILEDTDPEALLQRCRDAVARHGAGWIDPEELAAGLDPVLHTTLGSLGVTLAEIDASDRLAELNFELPLAGGDTAVRHATLTDLAVLLREHDLGALVGYPDLLEHLKPTALKGFLTGSIDAVLRQPGPRYTVVDYKTNWLGGTDLTAWHYRAQAMTAEMLRTHYVLQALLYSVALHRYLRWRQSGYDPHQHLGPVLYLFVRGMCGPDSPEGAGIFEWQPPPALIVALSDLLAGQP